MRTTCITVTLVPSAGTPCYLHAHMQERKKEKIKVSCLWCKMLFSLSGDHYSLRSEIEIAKQGKNKSDDDDKKNTKLNEFILNEAPMFNLKQAPVDYYTWTVVSCSGTLETSSSLQPATGTLGFSVCFSNPTTFCLTINQQRLDRDCWMQKRGNSMWQLWNFLSLVSQKQLQAASCTSGSAPLNNIVCEIFIMRLLSWEGSFLPAPSLWERTGQVSRSRPRQTCGWCDDSTPGMREHVFSTCLLIWPRLGQWWNVQ